MRLSARIAVAVAGVHTCWAAVGIVRPQAYGILLGSAGVGCRTRVMSAVDAAMAGAVVWTGATGRPLRPVLTLGASSDLMRAVALTVLFNDAPQRGRRTMVVGSVAGAALAGALAVLAGIEAS